MRPAVVIALLVLAAEIAWAGRYVSTAVDAVLVCGWLILTVGLAIYSAGLLRDLLYRVLPDRWWGLLISLGISAWAGVSLFLTGFAVGPEVAGVSVLGPTGIWPPNAAMTAVVVGSAVLLVAALFLLQRRLVPRDLAGVVVAIVAFFVLRDLAGTSARQLATPYTVCVVSWVLLVGFLGRPRPKLDARRFVPVLLLPALMALHPLLPASTRLILSQRMVFSEALMFPFSRPSPTMATCDPAPPTRQPLSVKRSPGIVLVVIDTLRFDRVNSDVMPNLNRFADEASLAFDRVYTPAPSTEYSFKSMFQLEESPSTLEVLMDEGVDVVAVPAHPGVASLMPDGVDIDRRALPEGDFRFALTSKIVTRVALERLEELTASDRPFVLLVHYYDPHQYYVPNGQFDRGSSREARYDSEVAYTDDALGPLLETVLDRDVTTIVTSDHGEELWDHGYVSHSYALYDESSRVFLAMYDADQPARTIDFPLTNSVISQLLLGSLTEHRAVATRGPVRLREPPRRGVVTGGYKAIWDDRIGVGELYDLRKDPLEEHNLYDEMGFPGVICARPSLFD